MLIRRFRPGDEAGQVRVYNAATAALPAYKPASTEEVARRYRGPGADPEARFYALDGDSDEVVAYCLYNPNGRVSYPWCLPGHDAARVPLFETMLDAMREEGFESVWAAYRADWPPVLDFLKSHGFKADREMINYLAETEGLPRVPPPRGMTVGPLRRDDLPRLIEVGRGLFRDDPAHLGAFYWDNPYFGPESCFALRPIGGGEIAGAGLVVADPTFADPSKVDPMMPCFRLGAMGTEAERLKRINGVVSFAFTDDAVGAALLSEAARRLVEAGVTLAAAQAPSDRAELVAFYDWFFKRQGAFPVLSRRLDRP